MKKNRANFRVVFEREAENTVKVVVQRNGKEYFQFVKVFDDQEYEILERINETISSDLEASLV